MRAFLAVPVPGSPGPDPAPPSLEHLTLHFLGEFHESLVAPLTERVAPTVALHRGFDLTIEGVGAFPSRTTPRIVWRGVGAGREELRRLALDVRQAVIAAGIPVDVAPFVPHLTLFRVRSAADAARARGLLDGRTPAPAPTRFAVTEVDLVESQLRPTGVEHRVVVQYPLAERSG